MVITITRERGRFPVADQIACHSSGRRHSTSSSHTTQSGRLPQELETSLASTVSTLPEVDTMRSVKTWTLIGSPGCQTSGCSLEIAERGLTSDT